jgi:hypothetical protein
VALFEKPENEVMFSIFGKSDVPKLTQYQDIRLPELYLALFEKPENESIHYSMEWWHPVPK